MGDLNDLFCRQEGYLAVHMIPPICGCRLSTALVHCPSWSGEVLSQFLLPNNSKSETSCFRAPRVYFNRQKLLQEHSLEKAARLWTEPINLIAHPLNVCPWASVCKQMIQLRWHSWANVVLVSLFVSYRSLINVPTSQCPLSTVYMCTVRLFARSLMLFDRFP